MVRLESMVSSAEAMKVARRGRPTFVVATERLGVVEVGPDCRLRAARKTAGLVSSQKVFPQGCRWGVDGRAVVEKVTIDGVGDQTSPRRVCGKASSDLGRNRAEALEFPGVVRKSEESWEIDSDVCLKSATPVMRWQPWLVGGIECPTGERICPPVVESALITNR